MAAPANPPLQVHPVIRYLRDHAWARRSLSLTSIGLLLLAVGLLGYPLYTNLYQSRVQARASEQLASPELQQKYRDHRSGKAALRDGDSLTRIEIPDIEVDTIVVEGTTPSALRAGAGHYPGTPLPCEEGNVAIAGHRTTYGKPFANVDLLKPGAEIVLRTPIGSCTYEVERAPFIVAPTDKTVVGPLTGKYLTLTSCHPKHSAAKRIIVRAKLVRSDITAT